VAIQNVNTVTLLEEIPTDGHSPMKFLCDDDLVYYCKYRSGHSLNNQEIDFLVYEAVCHYLLKHFDIPTPEIACVTLQKDSYDPAHLRVNKKYAKPGIVCFGSQEIEGSNLVSGLELVTNKHEFNKYLNPDDLIRIAFFDLWVANIDRGRNENFNLLTKTQTDKTQIHAFDNAFAFYGQRGLRTFNPEWELDVKDGLSRTAYFKSIVQYIPEAERVSIAEKIVNCALLETEDCINEAFTIIPATWQIPATVKDRVLAFLLNKPRLDTIRREVLLSITTQKT
jgi:hypothetical protein